MRITSLFILPRHLKLALFTYLLTIGASSHADAQIKNGRSEQGHYWLQNVSTDGQWALLEDVNNGGIRIKNLKTSKEFVLDKSFSTRGNVGWIGQTKKLVLIQSPRSDEKNIVVFQLSPIGLKKISSTHMPTNLLSYYWGQWAISPDGNSLAFNTEIPTSLGVLTGLQTPKPKCRFLAGKRLGSVGWRTSRFLLFNQGSDESTSINQVDINASKLKAVRLVNRIDGDLDGLFRYNSKANEMLAISTIGKKQKLVSVDVRNSSVTSIKDLGLIDWENRPRTPRWMLKRVGAERAFLWRGHNERMEVWPFYPRSQKFLKVRYFAFPVSNPALDGAGRIWMDVGQGLKVQARF